MKVVGLSHNSFLEQMLIAESNAAYDSKFFLFFSFFFLIIHCVSTKALLHTMHIPKHYMWKIISFSVCMQAGKNAKVSLLVFLPP